jgi:hypothetical protein
MASIRNIKKDIDYLVNEVISDCYTYLFLHNKKNQEQVVGIIEGIVNSRNDLITRVNNPEKDSDRKQLKKHYKEIYNDLFTNIDSSFTKLSELTK